MENPKAQLVDKLKDANNILVTVSRNPSVDQLAACIGLTLLLNKLGKHGAAVFSGEVPSTIEFLKPEDTIEKNTDGLRDFIIALDKSKADKLRYRVEDDVVRIFITPYRTRIGKEDLQFSQGDFNVDVVVALGVSKQEDLDGAITAHGRIMHDAVMTSINLTPDGGLGTINWHDPQASSLSEVVTELAQSLAPDLLDSQISTALLTGIVSETGRFGNERTTSQTMSISAALLTAGANQQLVATKLEEAEHPVPAKAQPKPAATEATDLDEQGSGTFDVEHTPGEQATSTDAFVAGNLGPAMPAAQSFDLPAPQNQMPGITSTGSRLVTDAPSLGGTLTANAAPESLDPSTDPLSTPASNTPLLNRNTPSATLPAPDFGAPEPADFAASMPPTEPAWVSPTPVDNAWGAAPAAPAPAPAQPEGPLVEHTGQTLAELEAAAKNAAAAIPIAPAPGMTPAIAQSNVDKLFADAAATAALGPIEALNAQPMIENLHNDQPAAGPSVDQPAPGALPAEQVAPGTTMDMPLPSAAPAQPTVNAMVQNDIPVLPTPGAPAPVMTMAPAPQVVDPNAPPPVPPPIPMPPVAPQF